MSNSVPYGNTLRVMPAQEYGTGEDRLVIDRKEYTATQVREALALTEESRNVYEQ